MKKIICTIMMLFMAGVLWAAETVIIISDSTAVDYRSKKNPYNRGQVGWEPMSGWGEFAADAALEGVTVINRSAGGYSSKTYWEDMQKSTRKHFRQGAWLLLSFGSNDARPNAKNPERNTTPDGTFPEYMGKIAADAKAAGMKVVIISPLPFYSTRDGKFANPLLKPYAEAAEKLAKENRYGYVDLFGKLSAVFSTMSDKEVRTHFMFLAPGKSPNWPRGRNDPLHLTGKGSKLAWETIRDSIRKDIPELSGLFR